MMKTGYRLMNHANCIEKNSDKNLSRSWKYVVFLGIIIFKTPCSTKQAPAWVFLFYRFMQQYIDFAIFFFVWLEYITEM